MVQVMLVGSYFDCMDNEKILDRCERALASALAALEEATGLQREEIGGTYYAFRELDCFAEDLANVA